jgi:hypothetical protein
MKKYSSDLYYAKLDVRKFFYRIDRDILKTLFEKKIKDKRFVNLMVRFANMGGDTGIPIGNLLSQIYALIYLNELNLELSHWTIEKISKGINFVGYRTWKSKKFVRKHSLYKFRKALANKEVLSIISGIGHAVKTATVPYYRDMIIKFNLMALMPIGVIKCLNM